MNSEASLIGETLWGFRFAQVLASKGVTWLLGTSKGSLLLFALLAPHYLL
jgi:hypothetical protein